ncbi:hypothetical protein EYF80_045255 [Liparis tanakae]|uniref:Uncharacterized protein n=1 Tax=Liparis tanakae TaxID=230148 RepID=A0A4Z2FW14_9TELE|nr:hypothetical protein EYF80_045255 [Liparis tanakae]
MYPVSTGLPGPPHGTELASKQTVRWGGRGVKRDETPKHLERGCVNSKFRFKGLEVWWSGGGSGGLEVWRRVWWSGGLEEGLVVWRRF